MNWVLNIIIGVLAVALIVLVIIRQRLKRRLESIDGLAGITKRSAYTGKVIGVRIVEHRETPGLGDPIEIERGPWITGFDGRSLRDPAADAWRVRRDGGAFDQLAGATITPRAVVGAVRRALQFVEAHGKALAEAPVDGTLAFRDGPPLEDPRR